MSDGVDVETVRRAALRTGLQVAAVSSGLVAGVLGLAALYVLHQSRPAELLEAPRPGEDKIYVDAHEVLLALVVLGLAAVLVVGFAAWGISRRAVSPLAAALRLQRAFVADASHELRTPLAVLDARVQVLQRRLGRGEPTDDVLAALRRDTGAMIDVVGDLLLLAETAEAQSDAAEGCDLRPAVEGEVEDLRLLAEERSVRLEAEVAGEARVPLSEVGLRRALVVLIDNAVQHSPPGAPVRVTAGVERGRAVVRVADRGAGIAGVEVERVFDRFAHGAETGERRGFGIGLSLVRDLAQRHGGRVTVESTSGEGTTMRLELPTMQ